MTKTITLVGCGSMGSAMLRGWLNSDAYQAFHVISPRKESVAEYMEQDQRVKWFPSPDALPDPIECLLIALKPFILDEVLPNYAAHVSPRTLAITVATGKTLRFYKQHLGIDVVRAMPNTPVSINKGVIGLVADPAVRKCFSAQIDAVLGSLGYTAWIETEEQLNQVTALSGSGPAYVYYMIEAMTKAGEHMGLPADEAYAMAMHTVAGAGAYAVESGIPVATLRENVTSPKGTTEQALNILMDSQGLEPLIQRAIEAAFQRAKELAK